MKVFVSSLITGMEPLRQAVVAAVRALGHEPVTAETFGARPEAPQVACLSAVRNSDCVVLVLGGRYGAVQASGLSATHEEFREARDRRPVLVYISDEREREPAQDAFIAEVQGWQGGQFTEQFSSVEELRDGVTRGVHRWELSVAAGAPDPDEMLARAIALLPEDPRNIHTGRVSLAVALAGGPRQAVLRPSELENGALLDHLRRTARFGRTPIFVEEEGATHRIDDHTLSLSQSSRTIGIDEEGAVSITLPLENERRGYTELPALIHEVVQTALTTAMRFGSDLLDYVDEVQRLSHVAIAVRINGADGRPWRTRKEHAAQPNSGSWGTDRQQPPVSLSPPIRPRAALRQQSDELAEDLTALLRRQRQNRY
jgi:hypothetical protein